jgi:hypothetical protein
MKKLSKYYTLIENSEFVMKGTLQEIQEEIEGLDKFYVVSIQDNNIIHLASRPMIEDATHSNLSAMVNLFHLKAGRDV